MADGHGRHCRCRAGRASLLIYFVDWSREKRAGDALPASAAHDHYDRQRSDGHRHRLNDVDSHQGVGPLRRLNRSMTHRDGRAKAFADHVFPDWTVVSPIPRFASRSTWAWLRRYRLSETAAQRLGFALVFARQSEQSTQRGRRRVASHAAQPE
jgi:hypothetical protein